MLSRRPSTSEGVANGRRSALLDSDSNVGVGIGNEERHRLGLGGTTNYWHNALIELDDIVGRVDQIRVPTIVVAGGRDRLIPPATAPELADVIPFAHLRVVAGVGHLLHVFAPEEVVRAVDDIEALGRRA